jgi:hypothetical protein
MTSESVMKFSRSRGSSRLATPRLWCVCALALFALCAAQAFAQGGKGGEEVDSVLTKAGTLAIVRFGDATDMKMELQLNGKKVYAIDEMEASFVAQFRMYATGEVIVMSVSEGGTACPAQFQIIRIEGEGKVSVTNEFGDCGDSPTITLELLPDEQITLRFQGYYRLNQLEEPGFKKPPPTTWVYKGGVLKELKAATPKRRGK